MALPSLSLPVVQNWSCHSCGGCCSEHQIEISNEEHQRILDQKWTTADGLTGPPVVWSSGPPWRKRYRLAHQPDGRCVFLDDNRRCRIHARFGEPAKPLACRLYPYALHPQGKSVAVSLRFSCPSVIANQGRAVRDQLSDLKELERLVVPAGYQKSPAPAISRGDSIDWPDFLALVDRLTALMIEAAVPLPVRVHRGLAWVHLLEQARLHALPGPQRRDFLNLITTAVKSEITVLPDHLPAPSSVGLLYFRLFAAQYARKDTATTLAGGLLGRWQMLRAILKFTRGTGLVPAFQAGYRPVLFSELEQPLGAAPEGSTELWTRYWQVKLQGLHFCGPAFYGLPLVEGFRNLMLVFPLTIWMARWKCRSDERTEVSLDDLRFALATVDHHHGYSPFLGQSNSRSRLRTLSTNGDLLKLCAWYGCNR